MKQEEVQKNGMADEVVENSDLLHIFWAEMAIDDSLVLNDPFTVSILPR